jgi:hypothetical protein
MITKAEATRNALAKGGSLEEIERQADNYVRQVGSVPFNNMIRALNMHAWNNTREEWERLAAALTARGKARGKRR